MLLLKLIQILQGNYSSLVRSQFDDKQREYQIEVHETAKNLRRQGADKGLVLLPTGSGKTVTILQDAFHVMEAVWTQFNGEGVFLYIVPDKTLRSQAVDDIKNFRPSANILETTLDPIPEVSNLGKRKVIVTTYQYLHANLNLFRKMPIRYVAIDEAHHSFAKSYDEIILNTLTDLSDLKNILFTVGMTATEIAIRGKRAKEYVKKLGLEDSPIVELRDLFGGNVIIDKTDNASYTEFIEKGYLAPIKNRAAIIRFKANGDTGEDFVRHAKFDYGKIYRKLPHDVINQVIWEAYRDKIPEYRKSKPTKITSLSIDHAHDLKDHFIKQGYPAHQIEVMHSGNKKYPMSDTKKVQIENDFKSGKIKILITIGMLREGWDFPGLYNLILGAPLYSEYLYKQEIGRLTRIHAGKTHGLVIDIVYNFGRYQSQNMFSVFGRNTLNPDELDQKKEESITTPRPASEDLSIGEINWLDETDFVNYLKPLNPKTHVTLSREGMVSLLGRKLSQKFAAHLRKTYSPAIQPSAQTLHGDIEVIKGKSGSTDSLGIKKEDFERFVTAEGFNFPKHLVNEQINPETHIVLNMPGMQKILGERLARKFAAHLKDKYPVGIQPQVQFLFEDIEDNENNEDIEVIKGKSGSHDFLGVKIEDFERLVLLEGFRPLQSINPNTHVVLSGPGMVQILGSGLTKKFATHLAKKYPIAKQRPTQTLHQNIEVIKGKSGPSDVLGVKKEHFRELVISEGFEFPEHLASEQINPETHVILSGPGMAQILGSGLALKFAAYLAKKYPAVQQPLTKILHKKIEAIKGKSGTNDVLGVKKNDFKKLVLAEGFEFPKHVPSEQINPETHVILSGLGMAQNLGPSLAQKFAAHLAKKYPTINQPHIKILHKNIEVIKGKSYVHDVLAVKKEGFKDFFEAEKKDFEEFLESQKKKK